MRSYDYKIARRAALVALRDLRVNGRDSIGRPSTLLRALAAMRAHDDALHADIVIGVSSALRDTITLSLARRGLDRSNEWYEAQRAVAVLRAL